ncbi:MAG: DUF2341 domain-containing protein, partial [Deltaproteobacteria bacterium]
MHFFKNKVRLLCLAGIAWMFFCFLQVFPAVMGLQEAYAAGPTFVDFSVATATAVEITVDNPSLTQEGDLLVAIMSTDGNGRALSPPDANWTPLTDNTGTNHTTRSWYKIAGDPASETSFTFNVNGQYEAIVCGILTIRDFDTSVPIQLPVGTNTGTDEYPTAPSISTTLDNSLIIRYFGADRDRVTEDTGYPGSPYTGVYVRTIGAANGTSSGVAYATQADHGPTGTAAFTMSGGDEWSAVTIAVRPGASGVTLADHAAGQVTNNFYGATTLYGAYLFNFQLTNNSGGQVTVDTVEFQLSSVSGIDYSQFTNLKIYVDTDGDGEIETGEDQVWTGSVEEANPHTKISFSSGTFPVDASDTVNYILRGDVSSLQLDDTVTIDLGSSNVTLTPSTTVGGSGVTSVTHTYCGDGNFSYYRSITIDHTLVGTDNSGSLPDGTPPNKGFPVLISLSGDWLKRSSGKIQSDYGYDITFRDSDGQTGLYHEIEKYDGDAGTLVAWVRIDSLSKSTDKTIYMYYGNSCNISPTGNPDEVWDDNYVGVWHLTDLDDSTGNGPTGTDGGTTSSTTGQMADARNFDANTDYINVGDSTELQP